MSTRHAIPVIALVLVLAADAATAAQKKVASTPPPPPTPAPRPDLRPGTPADTANTKWVFTPVTATPGPVSRTPGPTITPGSPVADKTTIAPFPIPGDTSRAAIAHAKQMNFPRAGLTLTEPLPPDDEGIRFIGPFKGGFYVPYRGRVFELPRQVDVLPEQLMEPRPEYPQSAIDAHIQGTVAVVAHVLADGTVGETTVVKSIPALDSAAVQSVKRLRFKPASYQGKPVAVWVGVPVRFTIH